MTETHELVVPKVQSVSVMCDLRGERCLPKSIPMTGPLTLEFIDLDKMADCLMGEAIGRAARREDREKADSMVVKMYVPDDRRFL